MVAMTNCRSRAMGSVVALLILCGVSRGVVISPPDPAPRDTLIRVQGEGDDVQIFVIGFADGKFINVDFEQLGKLLVFTGKPGSYLINGTEDGRRFQQVVNIVDKQNPNPPGPNPPEPDPPGPEPDLPADLKNKYGIGEKAYRAALSQGDKAQAILIGNHYVDTANRLHRGELVPIAADSARSAREVLKEYGIANPQWANTVNMLDAAMFDVTLQQGGGIAIWRDMIYEAGLAMQRIAK